MHGQQKIKHFFVLSKDFKAKHPATVFCTSSLDPENYTRLSITLYNMKLATNRRSSAFWHATPHRLQDEGTTIFHTSVNIYHPTYRNIPEGFKRQKHQCEN
jgi:hypothetical protein